MARTKTTKKAVKTPAKNKRTEARVSKPKSKFNKKVQPKVAPHSSTKVVATSPVWLERIRADLRAQQSPSSFILGALIIVVIAVLIFNYFYRPETNLATPQTDSQMTQRVGDVNKNNLPGRYTIKDGDTLYSIAEKYYGNGYLFQKLADANKLSDPNNLITGQVIDIPKLTAEEMSPSPSPTPTPTATVDSSQDTSMQQPADIQPVQGGQGGSENETIWGERITGTTYTVQEGDWLSKIAGRAYGDIYAFDKIAKANNIQNPNLIEPGMVLTIPR